MPHSARPRWMLSLVLLGAAALAAAPTTKPAPAKVPTPVQTDPDKYKVILENERVRVFRYHDEPGARTQMHHHESFVLYVLAPFKRRLTFPDGSAKERQFKTGDVIYMEAQDHIGENTGTTPTEAVLVELKEPGPVSSLTQQGFGPAPDAGR